MTITFEPPDAFADDLKAAYKDVRAILDKAIDLLEENIRAHTRYNEKLGPTKEVITELDSTAACLFALAAEWKTIEDAVDDWRRRSVARFEQIRAAAEKASALAAKDLLHPASILGRPAGSAEG